MAHGSRHGLRRGCIRSAIPEKIDLIPGFTRDVTGLGHHGTGDLEVRLRTEKDLERAGDLLRLSYAAA
ncbi:hypothetical protein SAMN05216223_13142 [Actinacidiphila yanglinensis]|uniref:DUF5655 domain-containing protein n=1 Tax=Actinacidiphila yanglinensis TaxID=310779 RepID=A0A1H6EDG9_9ACTN|nr:hypothetical protein [Actinacidiphila yanglinensis]SEG94845.1 hypothetical protein SAMN05216223_13142 [Actinacidiphila yanglinensis]